MNSNRRLVVVRHAQAESFADKDVERVLTDRGRTDARALGAWLRDQGIGADAAYVSYAARTTETWALVAEAAGWTIEPQVDGTLYSTDEEGVLDIVRDAEPGARELVVVGHNPTIGMVAQLLDDGEGTAGDLTGFPTAAAAVFELDCDWPAVERMCARLAAFHVGRG
ncbi:SixA phosphatase family protein [Nocardioides sp. SYSU DS0651]|uniref:SixA phosphatase family protein n=1 Tax=Nocardioides sp. SYSU DS0651 TaxID=3415955 RepID=UPI003F4B158F